MRKLPPVPTFEQLRDLISTAAANVHTLRYDRFEVGTLVYAKLKVVSGPRNIDHLGPLYGVPVVVKADMEPNAWRLFDAAGEVIKEGTL